MNIDQQPCFHSLNKGISKTVAQRLANRSPRKRIDEKIVFLDYLHQADPQKVTSPRGWLRRAIEDDYGPPDGYKSQAEREAEAATAEERRQAHMHQEALKSAQEAEKQQQALRVREEHLTPLREHYRTSETEKNLWSVWVSHIQANRPNGVRPPTIQLRTVVGRRYPGRHLDAEQLCQKQISPALRESYSPISRETLQVITC